MGLLANPLDDYNENVVPFIPPGVLWATANYYAAQNVKLFQIVRDFFDKGWNTKEFEGRMANLVQLLLLVQPSRVSVVQFLTRAASSSLRPLSTHRFNTAALVYPCTENSLTRSALDISFASLTQENMAAYLGNGDTVKIILFGKPTEPGADFVVISRKGPAQQHYAIFVECKDRENIHPSDENVPKLPWSDALAKYDSCVKKMEQLSLIISQPYHYG